MLAQINNPALNSSIRGLSGSAFIGGLLRALINLGFVAGAIVFIFILITGAIQWMTSGGEKPAIESARSKIINALVGILILFALYAIIKFIEYFFKVNILYINVDLLRITGGGVGGPPPVCGPGQKTCIDDLGNPFCWPVANPCPN